VQASPQTLTLLLMVLIQWFQYKEPRFISGPVNGRGRKDVDVRCKLCILSPYG